MQDVRKIQDDLFWVGGNDRRISLFENAFPVPRGVSYNSYVMLDEKTVVLDTVDKAVSARFFENLEHLLNGKKLDYLVVNHMEPDHCATMDELVLRYPEVTIVSNAKTKAMIEQFFTFDVDSKVMVIGEGDTLNTGKHTFTFYMAPMVHWPETMVTYEQTTKTLFSADAFGTFGALNGNLFADEVDFEKDWLDDARRYYTNIVGKYGTQTTALLKKAAGLEIAMLCPLHGPIWRKKIDWFVEKYILWGSYTPEENGVLIAYASVYGNTENAAEILAGKLAEAGIRNVDMYDVSVTHPSYILSQAFKYSHIVFASTTYNAGIFCNMETLLHDIQAHNLQNRTVALIENGTWAATSGRLMAGIVGEMKNMTLLEGMVSLKSSVKEKQLDEIDMLSKAIVASLNEANKQEEQPINHETNIEPAAMFKLPYGLFVLTAKQGEKDNGCIINTVMQVTDSPKRISIAVNKANFTHDMILETGLFNVSVLTQDAPFAVFKQFGFQSGRDADKFENMQISRSLNGLSCLPEHSNAVISGKVIEAVDCGTHTLFIADVTQANVISEVESVTYSYYQKNIKPKPQPKEAGKVGWVCKVCGYVYEGDPLPEDYICPLCKHGAADFERLK